MTLTRRKKPARCHDGLPPKVRPRPPQERPETDQPAIHRDFAIREIGCVVAYLRKVGFLPCEKHHLLTTGMHGNGKRRGEQFTVGLNAWSHRGVVPEGWTESDAIELLGPSYAREPAAFRALYPDALLLETQEALLKQWRDGVIG